MSRRLILGIVLTGVLSGVLAAVVLRPEGLPSILKGGDSGEPPVNPYLHLVAQASVAKVRVFAAPDAAAAPTAELANPTPDGAPLVFLVRDQQPGWYQVLLPIRPNGSVGWVEATAVTTTKHEFRIVVELGAHHITVFHRDGVFYEGPVGIGKGPTPTPIGVFYTKELLQPPNPNTAYGAYAYGLSGYSNVLTDFAGGDGVVGLHGTNDPSTIGTDVSHGCIRLTNEAITRLAKNLPLGVPVVIEP
jgi:lipoprotein-anchoring transpeptidase ErfK/SrfK